MSKMFNDNWDLLSEAKRAEGNIRAIIVELEKKNPDGNRITKLADNASNMLTYISLNSESSDGL